MNKVYNATLLALHRTVIEMTGAKSSTYPVGDATKTAEILEVPRDKFLERVNISNDMFQASDLSRRLGVGVFDPTREDFETLLVGFYFHSVRSGALVLIACGYLHQEVSGAGEAAKAHYAMSSFITGNRTRFYLKSKTVTRLIEQEKMSLAELSKLTSIGTYGEPQRMSYHEVNPGKEQAFQHFRTMGIEAMVNYFTTFRTNVENHPAI